MVPNNLLDAKNRDELRLWLIENCKRENECWVVVKRGRPQNDNTFWYIDAVEEAICFGWIDSTEKRLDNGITAQRLAPRKKNSLWSELKKTLSQNGKIRVNDRCRASGFAEYVAVRF